MTKPIDPNYRADLVRRIQTLPTVQRCLSLHRQGELFPKRHSRRRYLARRPVIEATIDQVLRDRY